MDFLGNGTVSAACKHSGYKLMRYLPFGGTLNFRQPFQVVWVMQKQLLTMLKVSSFNDNNLDRE